MEPKSELQTQIVAEALKLYASLFLAKLHVEDLHADNLIYSLEKKKWYLLDFNEVHEKDSEQEAAFCYYKELASASYTTEDTFFRFKFRKAILVVHLS